MKYAFITYDGHGLPIAHKLMLEGNDVIVGQVEHLKHMPKEEEEIKKRRLSLYDGLIEKISADKLLEKLKKENPKDWFIIGDFNYVYPYTEKLKDMGFFGLLPTKNDFELEEDRNMAKEYVFSKFPIFSIQEVEEFDKIEDALEFLKNSDKVYGVKGNNPDAPTYFPISNNPQIAFEEIEDLLINNKKLYESEGFILEEKIEDLLEFVPEIIVSSGKIVGMNIDLEVKPIGAGNIGYQTGDAASFIFWIEENSEAFQKLFKLFFEPSKEKWSRINEMVIWDAGVMYSPSRNKFYFTEFCSNRFGFGAIFNELSTFPQISEYFEKIYNQEPLFDQNVKLFGNSIRVFNEIKDNKNKHLTAKDLRIIANIEDRDIWLWDVYRKDNKLYTAGYDHNLAVLTTAGDNWIENFKKIDLKLSKGEDFVFPAMLYRRWFELIRSDYPNNFVQRMNFLIKFLNLNIEPIEEQKPDLKTLLEKFIEEI